MGCTRSSAVAADGVCSNTEQEATSVAKKLDPINFAWHAKH
jgi:hypothetical protein